jgi:excisionase family DNA binding protein
MEALIELTSKQDQKVASSSLGTIQKSIERISKQKSQTVDIRIAESGELITIPKKAMEMLLTIILTMSVGKSITLIPSGVQVSTQQAANMLNVSRPHIVKLIDEGKLPSEKVGSHRRIMLEDLIIYQKNMKSQRTKALAFLTKQAQELDMGY